MQCARRVRRSPGRYPRLGSRRPRISIARRRWHGQYQLDQADALIREMDQGEPMISRFCLALVPISALSILAAGTIEQPQLKTASNHPIQYYLSLPEGWTPARRWPVV